jgi:hypothetical protein
MCAIPLRPERVKCGPDVDAAGAARELWREVGRVAEFALRWEIFGGDRHRGLQRVRIADEGEAAVVGDVEPFVGIRGPRIGFTDTGGKVGTRGRGGGPEAESSIDVNPRTGGVGDATDFANGVDGAGVHVPSLRADDRRTGEGGDFFGDHATLDVDGDFDDTAAAEAEDAEGFRNGRVNLATDDDGDGRRSEEAIGLDVPTGARQHGVACGGECGEIGNGGAGDEGPAASRREVQNIEEPSRARPVR